MPRQTEPNANNAHGGPLQDELPPRQVRSENTRFIGRPTLASPRHRNADLVLRCEPERPLIERGDTDARVYVGDYGVHGVGGARGDGGDGECDGERR